jgi:hypothetical protein
MAPFLLEDAFPSTSYGVRVKRKEVVKVLALLNADRHNRVFAFIVFTNERVHQLCGGYFTKEDLV